MSREFKSELLVWVGIIICLAIIAQFQKSTPAYEQSTKFLVPPKEIVHVTFGYNDVVADSLWIRVIQDFDICDPAGKAGIEEYKKTWVRNIELDDKFKDADAVKLDEMLAGEWKDPRCHMSWVYHMLDRVTDLSPNFRRAYITGGLTLSIAVDDRMGAEKFYDKALVNFPNNWNLLFHAGYHSLYETRNIKKAADFFRRAAENGAPDWLYALAGKLYDRVGLAEVTVRYLKAYLERNPDAKNIEQVKERLNKALRVLARAKAKE